MQIAQAMGYSLEALYACEDLELIERVRAKLIAENLAPSYKRETGKTVH